MRVAVAEDQALLRDGLVRLFTDAGEDVVADVGDAEALLEALEIDQPDLVVVDVRMPPTHTDEGTRAAREIRERFPEVGVLILSQHVERRHILDLVGHPGFGYLLKDRVLGVADFLDAARRVATGGSALDPVVVATLVSPGGREDPLGALTAREREVLGLMAEGLSNAGIAARLWLTERTVETHVRHILLNLGIPATEDGHRRVLAVLHHLRAAQDQREH